MPPRLEQLQLQFLKHNQWRKRIQVSLLTQQLLVLPYLGISKEEYINYVYLYFFPGQVVWSQEVGGIPFQDSLKG